MTAVKDNFWKWALATIIGTAGVSYSVHTWNEGYRQVFQRLIVGAVEG